MNAAHKTTAVLLWGTHLAYQPGRRAPAPYTRALHAPCAFVSGGLVCVRLRGAYVRHVRMAYAPQRILPPGSTVLLPSQEALALSALGFAEKICDNYAPRAPR